KVTLFYSPEGFMIVAPLPDKRYRIVAMADNVPKEPSIEFVQNLLDARGPKDKPGRIHQSIWSSRFRVHHRVAASPRKGRVLLCGGSSKSVSKSAAVLRRRGARTGPERSAPSRRRRRSWARRSRR